jgi:hypothetical protein
VSAEKPDTIFWHKRIGWKFYIFFGPIMFLWRLFMRYLKFNLWIAYLILFSTFLLVFLIPSLLMFSVGNYFIWSKCGKKIFTSFTFAILQQYLCIL